MEDYLTRTLKRIGIRYLDNRNGGLNYGRDLTSNGSGWLWLLCSKEELMEHIDELNDCGIEVEYVQVRADQGKAPYHAYVDKGENRAQAPIGYFARESGRKTSSTRNDMTLDHRLAKLQEDIETVRRQQQMIKELLARLPRNSQ